MTRWEHIYEEIEGIPWRAECEHIFRFNMYCNEYHCVDCGDILTVAQIQAMQGREVRRSGNTYR